MDDLFPDIHAAALPSLGENIYVGTSGFMFADWRGTVYPAHLSDHETLPYYLNVFAFNALELNFTFYTAPSPRLLEPFVQRTPPAYQIAVKAFKGITHARPDDVTPGDFAACRDALAPARDAGKLAAVLLQFPYAFHSTEGNRVYLKRCRAELPDDPLAIEFRHKSWASDETDALLKAEGLACCAVDEPALEGLVPLRTAVTAPLGYARFHGRNPAWFSAGEKERYNYLYSDDELRDFVQRVRQMAKNVKKMLVFFNNCYMGKAIKNALRFRELLSEAV